MHDIVEAWVILKTEPDTSVSMQVVYGWGVGSMPFLPHAKPPQAQAGGRALREQVLMRCRRCPRGVVVAGAPVFAGLWRFVGTRAFGEMFLLRDF